MPLNSAQLMDAFLKEQEERHRNPEKYRGWRTGVADLDKVTGGLVRGWYFVVSGKRKSGKTAFMATLRTQLGLQGVRFLSISLEENNLQIAERQVSNVGDVDRTLFRDVALTQDDWTKVFSAAENIREWPGYWDYGVEKVEEIKKLCKDLEIEVLMVDYIQLMSASGSVNRSQEISAISRSLKLLTLQDPPLTVVAAAQLNDDGDYLWSRDVGRDADVAIKLTRVNDEYGHVVDNRLKLEIADSRHSAVDDFEVMFNGARSLVGSLQIIDINDLLK